MYLFLAFAVAIFLFIPVVNYLMMMRRVTGSELRLVEGHRVKADEVPQGFRDHFNAATPELESLGFEFSHYEKRKDIQVAVDTPSWVLVLKNQSNDTFAEIWNGYSPDVVVNTQIAFVSFYENCDVVTVNVSGGNIRIECDYLKIRTVLTDDVAELYKAHGQFLVDLKTQGIEAGLQQSPTSKEYPYRLIGAAKRHYAYQEQQGYINGSHEKYRIPVRSATKIIQEAKSALTKEMEFKAEKLEETNADDLPDLSVLEVDAYHRQQKMAEHSKLSGWFKVLSFLVSVVFFAVLFGATISWSLLLSLIPVLLIHELGHLAAMRWLGYRDLHMFFVPLGAVAIGTKKDATPWQEAVVLLAGPVPGIVLALLAQWMIPEPAQWLEDLILVSLIINYSNLLPFPPLDGGQLMQLVLYNRFPILKVVIKITGIVLFSLLALMLQDSLILIFALFLMYASYTEYKAWRLAKTITPDIKDGMTEDEKLSVIFQKFRTKKWLFFEKYAAAESVISSFTKSIANFKTSALIMMCYVAIIVGPGILIAVHTFNETQDYYASDATSRIKTVEEWDALLLAESEPGGKVSLLLEAAEYSWYEDVNQGRQYIKDAIAISHELDDVDVFAEIVNKQLLLGHEQEDQDYGIALYEELESRTSPDSELLTFGLDRLIYVEDDELAVKYLNKALHHNKQSGDTYYDAMYLSALSKRYLKTGRYNLAEQHAISASETEQEDEYYRYSNQYDLADFYVEFNEFDKAQSILQALSVQTANPYVQQEALIALGWIAFSQDRIKQAKRYFKKSAVLQSQQQLQDIEDMGFAVRFMIGREAIAQMKEETILRTEQKLVVAHAEGNQSAYDNALNSILDQPFVDDLPSYLERIRAVKEVYGVWSLRAESLSAILHEELGIPVAQASIE